MKIKHIVLIFGIFLLSTAFLSPKSHQNHQLIVTKTNINTEGKELTVKKGCTLCHNPEKKIVGPSFKEIAVAYEGNHDKLLKFLNGKAQPIVRPEEFQFMKPVLNQLKHTPKEEVEAIAKYIISLK